MVPGTDPEGWEAFQTLSEAPRPSTEAQVTESNQQIIGLVRRGFDRPVLQPFTSTAKRVAESVCGRDVQVVTAVDEAAIPHTEDLIGLKLDFLRQISCNWCWNLDQ